MVREVTNEQVLERIEEKQTLINNIVLRKVNWIGHNPRINCLHDVIKGQMRKMQGIGRRRTLLLDDLRNRRQNVGAK